MIKKEYLQPAVTIVHVVTKGTILTGSANGTGANVTWNGDEQSFGDYFGS